MAIAIPPLILPRLQTTDAAAQAWANQVAQALQQWSTLVAAAIAQVSKG